MISESAKPVVKAREVAMRERRETARYWMWGVPMVVGGIGTVVAVNVASADGGDMPVARGTEHGGKKTDTPTPCPPTEVATEAVKPSATFVPSADPAATTVVENTVAPADTPVVVEVTPAPGQVVVVESSSGLGDRRFANAGQTVVVVTDTNTPEPIVGLEAPETGASGADVLGIAAIIGSVLVGAVGVGRRARREALAKKKSRE